MKPTMSNTPPEGFVTINPPLPLFTPSGPQDRLRGYVLSRHENGVAAFYVLQLTRPHQQNGLKLQTGRLMAVLEVESIRGLAKMLPYYVPEPPLGQPKAKHAFEVVFDPYAETKEGWQHLCHVKQVAAGNAAPAIAVPPSFPMVALMGASMQQALAAAAELEQRAQQAAAELEQDEDDEPAAEVETDEADEPAAELEADETDEPAAELSHDQDDDDDDDSGGGAC